MDCVIKLVRTPVKTLLLFLLFTIGGILVSLGASLYINAKETGKKIDAAITTIAVPNVVKIRADSGGDDAWVVDGPMTRTADNFYEINKADKELYYRVMEAGTQVEIGTKDPRRSYYAYSKDLLPLLIEGKIVNDPSNFAVFEAVCKRIEEKTTEIVIKNRIHTTEYYTVEWEVVTPLALHPSYKMPVTMLTSGTVPGNESGNQIEQGRRYLIAGEVNNAQKLNEKERKNIPVYFRFFIPSQNSNGTILKDSFIPYIELKNDISADAFLNSKEGSDFRRLVNNCISIVNSTIVISTDNLNSILQFNLRKAYIIKGREIMQEEYEKGKKVCLISAALAEYNGINVGDGIKLSLANASYSKMMHMSGSSWDLEADPFTIRYSPEEQFEVVGIYQAPEWNHSEYALTPNAIFVPSESVSSISFSNEIQDNILMEYDIAPILYSIIIPNNKLEVFKASVGQTGMGQYFLYYDQGYSYISIILETLTQNAIIVFSFCALLWIFVLFLFILLYVMKEKFIAGIMMSLGTGVKKTFLYLFIPCLLLAALSALSSAIISNAMEEKATKISYESAIEHCDFNDSFSDTGNLDYGLPSVSVAKRAALVAGLQFVLILCVSASSIFTIVRKCPMRLLHSKEG